ncbi:MobC family replication-relaxation protein, partial [Klebsiella pneumoniae]
EIWYICPDRATQVRVQRAILSVDEIVNPQTGEARKTAELDRERLFACFKFMTTE